MQAVVGQHGKGTLLFVCVCASARARERESVCVYVYVCVCVCVCVCVSMYVCIHTHTHTHSLAHTQIVTYPCRVDRQRLACHGIETAKSNLLDEFAHAVVHTHTHSHTHAHAHAHIHIGVLLIFLHIFWMSLHTRFRTACSC